MTDSSGSVPFRITICGLDELGSLCEAGVSHVLSILDPAAPAPPAFGAFGGHERLELRFDDVIEERPDYLAPTGAQVEEVLAFGRTLDGAAGERHLLVHCHAGISRSTAATTLILAQARPDRAAAEILDEILAIREKAWPNLRMIEFGDAALGRGGTLVREAARVYAAQLRRRPPLEQFFIAAGREREVRLALSGGATG